MEKTRVKAQHSLKYRPLPGLLRQLREDAGLNQRELGAILKKNQQYVFNSEHGLRRVDPAEMVTWAEACGITPTVAFNRFLKLIK